MSRSDAVQPGLARPPCMNVLRNQRARFSKSPRHSKYLADVKIRDATHDKQGLKLNRFPGL